MIKLKTLVKISFSITKLKQMLKWTVDIMSEFIHSRPTGNQNTHTTSTTVLEKKYFIHHFKYIMHFKIL